jgi:hypothetical protein
MASVVASEPIFAVCGATEGIWCQAPGCLNLIHVRQPFAWFDDKNAFCLPCATREQWDRTHPQDVTKVGAA